MTRRRNTEIVREGRTKELLHNTQEGLLTTRLTSLDRPVYPAKGIAFAGRSTSGAVVAHSFYKLIPVNYVVALLLISQSGLRDVLLAIS